MQTMTDVELLCEALELTHLEELNKELAQVSQDKTQAREVLMKEVSRTVHHIFEKHYINLEHIILTDVLTDIRIFCMTCFLVQVGLSDYSLNSYT